MIKSEYLEKVYDYLNNNNYIFFTILTYGSSSAYAYKKESSNILINSRKVTMGEIQNIYEDISKEKFISLGKDRKIVYEKNDNILYDFFIDLYRKSIDKKFILKNIKLILQENITNNIYSVLGEVSTKQDIIKNIKLIPISTWGTYDIDFKKLDNLLIKFDLPKSDIDKFYIDFFKNRKIQISDSSIAPKVRDFLIGKYGKNKELLEPYFDFFQPVKKLFIDEELDLTSQPTESLSYIRVNCKETSKRLAIDGYSPGVCEVDLINVLNSLKTIRNLVSVDHSIDTTVNKICELRCYHNSTYSQNDLKRDINLFFNEKRKNPAFKSTKETLTSFYLKMDLEQKLIEINNLENKDKDIKKFKL